MQLLIYGFIIIANVVAILSVYYSFGKSMEKNKRLLGTMITVGVVYIIVSIVYFFSSLGLEKNISSSTTKQLLTLTAVPIMTLLITPYGIHSYVAMKNKTIKQEVFKKRITILFIIGIILIIVGFFYFRSNQKNILKIQQNINNLIEMNAIVDSETNVNNEENDVNDILNNVVNNNTNIEGNILNNAI